MCHMPSGSDMNILLWYEPHIRKKTTCFPRVCRLFLWYNFFMLAIVIPTYNERSVISKLIERIHWVLRDYDYFILVVDDSSPDGTGSVVQNLNDPRVSLLERKENRGLGASLKEGLTFAVNKGAEFIVTMDADFSHDPQTLLQLINTAQSNDLVIGSRYVTGGRSSASVYRWGISKIGNEFVRLLLGLPFSDSTSNFRCYRASSLENTGFENLSSNDYNFVPHFLFVLFYKGAVITEIPISFNHRAAGRSKFSFPQIFKNLATIIKLLFAKRRYEE